MPDKVFIFDTTLRDAEQTPGCALNGAEKLEIARQLAKLNVDVIEAGFPISSPGEFEAVKRISGEITGPEICALSRVIEKDIAAAWDAVKDAPRARIHTFVGTSDIHIIDITRSDRETILRRAVHAVAYAKSLCAGHPNARVEFSPMDATRTERAYLRKVVLETAKAGVDIMNIPDTVGYAITDEFGDLIADVRAWLDLANYPDVVVSVHCHDDLGLATANSIGGIRRGARQVECTMNGLGERAGNASLEEIVMAIRTRKDRFGGLYTEINPQEICTTSRLVSRTMGVPVQPNKAIIGVNAFAHSSGIHQDGVIKARQTFEIIDPADIGAKESEIILSPRSGRSAVKHRLNALGYEVSSEELNRIYERFLIVADKKKHVHDADLEAIVKDEIRLIPEMFKLEHVSCSSEGGKGAVAEAFVGVWVYSTETSLPQEPGNVRDVDYVLRIQDATGDGPVHAAYKALDLITKIPLELVDYKIHGATGGKDAIGEVTIKVQDNNGDVLSGYGASTDIVEASVKAYLHAVNKAVHERKDG